MAGIATGPDVIATHGVRTIDNLRRLTGVTDEAELKVGLSGDFITDQLQVAVDSFENSIAEAAQRLESEGKTGLILLPGVKQLLETVRLL